MPVDSPTRVHTQAVLIGLMGFFVLFLYLFFKKKKDMKLKDFVLEGVGGNGEWL